MIKFTEQELKEINHLQNEYSKLGIQLVQIKLAQAESNKRLEELNTLEKTVTDCLLDLNSREIELADRLQHKYGVGRLDTKTGEFIPNTESK